MKLRLVEVACQRCGRQVTTTAQSLLGLDSLKRQWGILCQGCVTGEERYLLLQEQGRALAGREEVKP